MLNIKATKDLISNILLFIVKISKYYYYGER